MKVLRPLLGLLLAVPPLVAQERREVTVEWIFSDEGESVATLPRTHWNSDGTLLLMDGRRPKGERTIERVEPETGARKAALNAKAALDSLRPMLGEKDMPDAIAWPDSFDSAGRRAVYALADDLFLLDLSSGRFERLTRTPEKEEVASLSPDGKKVVFCRAHDLYVIDLATKETKQLTHFTDYDIKFPSIGKDSIVFEQAGYIWRYDLASAQATPVPIEIKEDFAIGRSALVDAAKHIETVNLAPDGERSITVARGDLFSVPAKNGTPRNLTKTSGAHERDAVWSPDGKWIAYNSDVTGENELYVRSQDGKGEPQQITSAADTYYYAPKWSPDSKKLAFVSYQMVP
jgi:tricorn protease-like protein